MKNEITQLLREIAELLELKGENPFKARAYTNAADIIADRNIDIVGKVNDGTIREVEGIGEALQQKLTEFVKTGRLEYYEKLKAEIPPEMIAISRIKGVGAKKAKALVETHKIQSLEELEMMAENGELAKLKGFGEKSALQILDSINESKEYIGKFRLDTAYTYAQEIIDILKQTESISKVIATGELRRWLEIIETLDFVVIPSDMADLQTKLNVDYDIKVHPNLITFDYKKIPVKLHIADEDNFGLISHNLSCSEQYLEIFNDVAKNTFAHKNNYFYDSDKKISLPTEQSVYEKLTMQYVEPETREDGQAIQYAITSDLPKLIEESDMKGMLHCHSTWSDGVNTIEEMALESKRLGYTYFAITDHSKTAVYANGLSPKRVLEQHKEIDELNAKDLGIKILKGIESDILNDGSLDYDEEILSQFDLVVASVHSNFTMSKNEMTDRVIRALMSPYTTILGHPTGRILLRRKGYEIDQKAVIDAAAEYKVIIEINANPYRLDLDWRLLGYAKQKGVKIAINPDAHSLKGLQQVKYGIHIARKGWLTQNDIVNTYSLNKFKMNCLSK